MNTLQSLQSGFQQDVMVGNINSTLFAREQAEGGFSIYVNAYRARLMAALRENYPMLCLALGDDMFDTLATAYVEQQPSRFRSIRWFGDGLADFMDGNAELTPHPSLSDLARMDWALRQSFDAADDDRLVVDDLAQLAPEAWATQCFRLRASVMLRDLHWSVEPVWQALNEDAAAETSPPEPHDHTLLVWRNKLDCHWRSLSNAEAAGLKALAADCHFADICEQMITVDETITPTAAAMMLRQWVEHGLLAGSLSP
jgi:Putative DNA-binding domain